MLQTTLSYPRVEMNGISGLSSSLLELVIQAETSLFILSTPYATVQVHHKKKSSNPKEKLYLDAGLITRLRANPLTVSNDLNTEL